MANYAKILGMFYPDMEWEGGSVTNYSSFVWKGGTPASMPNQATLDAWDPYVPIVFIDDNKHEIVRNESGSTITKGTPVYAVSVDPTSEQTLVAPCDADDSNTFPCIGLMLVDLPNNQTGAIVVDDKLEDFDTSAFAKNDPIYVASGGGLTTVMPTGTVGSPPAGRAVQQVGRVTRDSATDGEIIFEHHEVFIGITGSNDTVVFDGENWVAVEGGGTSGSNHACVVTRRITTNQAIDATPTETILAFQQQDIQNNTDVIVDTSDTVITVLEDGLYQISLNLIFSGDNNDCDLWLVKNGTEVTGTRTTFNPNSKVAVVTPVYIFSLTAGDALGVRCYELTNGNTVMEMNSTFSITRLAGRGNTGATGAPGPAGSGSNLNIYNDGEPVTGTPHTVINCGDGIIATNDGSGQVTLKGAVKQVVHKTVTANLTTSVVISPSVAPTSTDGVALDSLNITTTGAGIVHFQMVLPCDSSNDAGVGVAFVHRGTTIIGVAAKSLTKKLMDSGQIILDFYDTPGAGTHTYSVRVGVRNGNVSYFNQGGATADPWGGYWRKGCNITLTELAG